MTNTKTMQGPGILPALAAAAHPIAKLAPFPLNATIHDVDRIAESLRVNGQYSPVVANRSTGEILAGHGTVEAAKSLGWTEVAVSWVDTTDQATAARIVVGDNRHADIAHYDESALHALVSWLPDLDGTGMQPDEARRLAERLNAVPVFDEPLAELGNGHTRTRKEDLNPMVWAGWFRWKYEDHERFDRWFDELVHEYGASGAPEELRRRLELPPAPPSKSSKTREAGVPGTDVVECDDLPGVERIPVDELVEHPGNARRGRVSMLEESLNVTGQYRPVIVQASTRYVIKGNHTLQAARRLGWDTVLAVVHDVDDETAARILLADNFTSDTHTYNSEKLADLMLLAGLPAGTGWTDGEWDAFMLDMGRRDFEHNGGTSAVRFKHGDRSLRIANGTLLMTFDRKMVLNSRPSAIFGKNVRGGPPAPHHTRSESRWAGHAVVRIDAANHRDAQRPSDHQQLEPDPLPRVGRRLRTQHHRRRPPPAATRSEVPRRGGVRRALAHRVPLRVDHLGDQQQHVRAGPEPDHPDARAAPRRHRVRVRPAPRNPPARPRRRGDRRLACPRMGSLTDRHRWCACCIPMVYDRGMATSDLQPPPKRWPRRTGVWPGQTTTAPDGYPEIPEATPVLSRSRAIRGLTVGTWQPCPVKACLGDHGDRNPQIGVDWETGQLMYICAAGWQIHTTPVLHLLVVRGGELSARYVNPRDPIPEPWHPREPTVQVDWSALGWTPRPHHELAHHHTIRPEMTWKKPPRQNQPTLL